MSQPSNQFKKTDEELNDDDLTFPLADNYPILLQADSKGGEKVLVEYGQDCWDFTTVAGCLFNFYFYKKDNRTRGNLSEGNWRALKVMTAFYWIKYKSKLSFATICQFYRMLRSFLVICTRNGIDINTTPLSGESAYQILSAHTRGSLIVRLALNMYPYRRSLGFHIISPMQAKIIERSIANPKYNKTPYIPARIWDYQIGRIEEFIREFLSAIGRFEKLFDYLITEYHYSPYFQKRKKGRVTSNSHNVSPFNKTAGGKLDFYDCAVMYKVDSILERWMINEGRTLKRTCSLDGPRILSSYCSAVCYAGLLYLANVSGMRKRELKGLRTDCSKSEFIDMLGTAYFLQSATTKTIDDPEALWVADEFSAEVVSALGVIARMRVKCANIFDRGVVDKVSDSNPKLHMFAFEPWGGARGAALDSSVSLMKDVCYSTWKGVCPNLFDESELVITEQDYLEAKKYTPSLDPVEFAPGNVWPLALHQLRRTILIRAIENDVSIQSIQYQAKHRNIMMSHYYTENFQGKKISKEMTTAFMVEVVESVVRGTAELKSDNFVSIYGSGHKSRLIEFVDISDLDRLRRGVKDGTYSVRETFYGVCLKRSFCSSGGISYVGDCVDCTEGLGDRRKIGSLTLLQGELESRLYDMSEGELDYLAVESQISAVKRSIKLLGGGPSE